MYNCAYVYRRLAVYPVAITLQSAALNMWTALCDAKPALEPTMAACLNELGCAFAATHELAKALKHHQRALDIRRKCLASVGGRAEHEAAASSMHRLAMLYLAKGNTAAAKKLCEEALDTAGAVHNSDSPHYTVAHANQCLARARYSVADTVSAKQHAVELMKSAVAMFRATHGERTYHRDVADAWTCLAWMLLGVGDDTSTASANQLFNDAIDMYRRMYGGIDHCDLAHALHGLGRVHMAMGQLESSLELHNAALTMYEGVFGNMDSHPSFVEVRRGRDEVAARVEASVTEEST